MNMNYPVSIIAISLMLFTGTSSAAEESVSCVTGHELKAALAGATPGTILHVSGICYGPINIKSNDLLLIGNQGDSKTVLQNSPFLANPQNIVSINHSIGVWITGFEIRNGLTGIAATKNSSFTLNNIDLHSNVHNLALNNASVQLTNVNLFE